MVRLGLTSLATLAAALSLVSTQAQPLYEASASSVEAAQRSLAEGSSSGIERRSVDLVAADDGKKDGTPFSAIVVFGASYCDNAHPRPAQYNDSLKPLPYWKGHWSNGPTFVEYLANGLLGHPLKLLDYAYGGAQIDNTLTHGSMPDTKTQVELYRHEVRAGTVNRGSGKVLHIWWIGINPLSQIFADAVTADTTLSTAVKLKAAGRVDAGAAEVIRQLRAVHDDTKVTALPSDFLVLPIPPLEIVPVFSSMALMLARGNSTLAARYLAYVGELTTRYNTALIAGVNGFRASESKNWVRSHDVVSYWRDVDANPAKHGFTNVKNACYDSSITSICSTPDTYEYWDGLHPTTAAHRAFAVNLVPTILRGSTKKAPDHS